jgi:hypothetical protein
MDYLLPFNALGLCNFGKAAFLKVFCLSILGVLAV